MSNDTRITEPGKFQGEREAVRQAYDTDLNGFDSGFFVDVETGDYFFHSYADDGEPVFGRIDSQGFVTEITETSYFASEAEAEESAE